MLVVRPCRIAVSLVISVWLGLGCSDRKAPIAGKATKDATVADVETSMARARLREGRWDTTRSIDFVDPDVLRILKARFGQDDRLARAEEALDWTGVSDRARRRFNFGARSRSGQTWVLAYEVGPPDYRVVVVLIELSPAPRIVMVASGLPGKHTRNALGFTVHQLAGDVGSRFPLYPLDSAVY